MYATSLPGVRVWLSSLDAELLVDVSPFWAGTPVLVVVTTSGGQMAFPGCPSVLAPAAPAEVRPAPGGTSGPHA